MKNIEYVITAEFHIDRGPSIVHQFPEELGGIQKLAFLPEIMLPDQIHKREGDFTLFLLYRNKASEEYQYLFDEATCEDEPYYLYTIVTNSMDESYRRGSRIKSLSIVTKLSYFKNFRPLMIIYLDRYFHGTDSKLLRELYEAINGKDFQVGSSLSITKKLLITSVLDLFINEKIYSDESFRNKVLEISGGESKELFIRKDLSFNSVVNCNGMSIPVKIPMVNLPDTIGDYMNPTDLNLKANLISVLTAKLATTLQHDEITIYGLQTPPIIILLNAVLTGKKIIVLSYENSASHIIDNVLLILKIVGGGGILNGLLTRYNVFPILDVSKIDLLEQCDSYIAGTINPFFKHNDKLWDLLYDLDTNEITLSATSCYQETSENLFKSSIISEDAKFLSNLQLSLFTYNDDLTTIQLIFRRHINEIIRILLSLKNFNSDLIPQLHQLNLLLEGIGYYWHSDASKLLEVTCYQLVSTKFQQLLYNGTFSYSLLLPNLANDLNAIIDLQHHLQSLNSLCDTDKERRVWQNILKYLISGETLEVLLLLTYLMPPNSSISLQSSSIHGGSLTIFDKNRGIEILLINLFHYDDEIKTIVVMILKELQDNFLGLWCVSEYLKTNPIYETAFADLSASVL